MITLHVECSKRGTTMALHIRTSHSVISKKSIGVFFAIFALFMQPIVGLNIPSVIAAGANITRAEFENKPTSVEQGERSTVFQVRMKNAANGNENVDAGAQLEVSSSSSTGRFAATASGGFGTSNTQTFSISSGTSLRSFYYMDSAAGAPTITATAKNGNITPSAVMTVTATVTVTSPTAPILPALPTIDVIAPTCDVRHNQVRFNMEPGTRIIMTDPFIASPSGSGEALRIRADQVPAGYVNLEQLVQAYGLSDLSQLYGTKSNQAVYYDGTDYNLGSVTATFTDPAQLNCTPENIRLSVGGLAVASGTVTKSSSARLIWDTVAGSDRYEVKITRPDGTIDQHAAQTTPRNLLVSRDYFGVQAGFYEYQVRARNAVTGEWSAWTNSVRLGYDIERPSVALDPAPASDRVTSSQKLTIKATDDVALNKIVGNIYQNGVLLKSTSKTVTGDTKEDTHEVDLSTIIGGSALPEGSYELRYNASDKSGGPISQTGRYFFAVDNTAPVVTVNGSTDSGRFFGPGRVGIAAVDADLSRIVIDQKRSNGDFTLRHTYTKGTNFTTTANIAWLGDGTYRIQAFDTAGNGSVIVEFTIDTTAPTVNHLSVDRSPTNENTIRLNGTVTDRNLKDYNVRIYNADRSAVVSPWIGSTGTSVVNEGTLATLDISSLTDGQYWVRVWADDKAGNRTGINTHIYVLFTVDRTPPTVVATEITPNDVKSEATVTMTLSEKIKKPAGWDLSGDGKTITRVYEENNDFSVNFEDLAGNQGLKEFTINVIDTVAPELTNLVFARNTDGTYTIRGLTDDTAPVNVSLFDANGNETVLGPVQPFNGSWSVDTAILEDGEYTVVASSTDAAGNPSEPSTLVLSAVTPPEDTQPLNSRSPSLLPALTTVPPAATTIFATNNVTQQADAQTPSTDTDDEGDVLGIQDTAPTDTVAAVTPSEAGWKIFGIAWYWWLVALAAIAAAWWLLAGLRRRNSEQA